MKIGLRAKLLIPTLGVVILSMSLAGLFSAKKASEELWVELINSSKHIGQGLANSLGIFVQDFQAMTVIQSHKESIVQVFLEKNPETLKAATEALNELTKFDPSIQGAILLDTKGDVYASNDSAATGNFSDREYFKLAMQGKANVSEPTLSRVTNKPVFLAAAPVSAGGKIVGVLYTRVDLGKFSEDIVAPVKVGQSGFAYLADKSGLVFGHPDKNLILKYKLSDFDWGRSMLDAPSGVVRYEQNGKEVSAIFTKEKTTGWLAVVTVDASDVAAASGKVRNASILFGGVGILLVCAVVIFIVGQMLKALSECVQFSESVAGGDLERVLTVNRTDELGRLAQSLRAMVNSLRDMIGTAKQKTEEAERQTAVAKQATDEAEQAKAQAERAKAEGMLHAAERLEQVVAIVSSASEELSAQIDECTQGAREQSDRVGETATAMEEMNATVLEVAKNASHAADTADNAKKKAESGASIVSQVVQGIANVQKQALDLKTNMTTLGAQAQGIGQVMNVINDIADQTNLLALNAAIEAARAGEAGRGFAVVADEVRKLAEKTMAATKEVGDAIHGIQDGTKLNIANVEKTVTTIESATELATKSGESLKEIVTLVDQTTDQVRSIAAASEQQSSASDEINHSIEDINRISTQTSEAMHQSSLAVSELASQSQVLSRLIEEMQTEGGASSAGHPPVKTARAAQPKRLALN